MLGAVVAIICASSALRISGIGIKRCVQHDETISLMAAACKSQAFQDRRLDLANRWVAASEWQRFHEIETPLCFAKIQSDLIVLDIHPPLYFWALHIAGLFVGLNATTGPLLNVVFHAASLVMLFLLARELSLGRAAALTVIVVWSFAPSALSVTYFARQYEMVTFFALSSLLMFTYVIGRRRWRLYAVLLTAAELGALLTNFQGAFVLAAVGLCAILALLHAWLRRKDRRAAAPLAPSIAALASTFVAFALFLAVHWGFWKQLATVERRLAGIEGTLRGAGDRAEVALERINEFFSIDARPSLLGFAVLAGLLLIPAGIQLFVRRRQRETTPPLWTVSYVGLATLGGLTVLQYVSYRAPAHAMDDARYLAMAWPLLALVSVQAASYVVPDRAARIAYAGLIAVVAWYSVPRRFESPALCGGQSGNWRFANSLDSAEKVATNDIGRGRVGTLFPVLDADTLMFGTTGKMGPAQERRFREGVEDSTPVLVVGGKKGTRPFGQLLSSAGFSHTHAPSLTDLLLEPDALVVISVRDEAQENLPTEFVDAIADIGGHLGDLKFRGAYAAIIEHGKLVAEQLGPNGIAHVTRSPDAETGSPKIEVDSRGFGNKQRASIRIGGRQYSPNRRGLNIVVYDLRRQVKRHAFAVDTHLPPGANSSTFIAVRRTDPK